MVAAAGVTRCGRGWGGRGVQDLGEISCSDWLHSYQWRSYSSGSALAFCRPLLFDNKP